ncbi:MAG: NAD(P)-dependent oxidoreductase [Clostridium sp.]|nr:NAD(P)-dependent oxidoreductase [Acetatifactor muris]MCM1526252.1 NAD(P)-dependent oxidoreductase [Bacteroides sp.]MCM1562931.1 NAD(P)-dependent oxidoreductase [Clostridium sp.]
MNILLIGGCSSVVNNLIIKLNKEGHRVYLLTGNRYHRLPYQKVFERYNFSYDSDCLNEIFESITPDLTIFMGAYDTNFNWEKEETEAVRYSAAAMNILMGYATVGEGRFIYLSSDEVYGASYEEDITENTPVSPGSFRGMVLAQTEEMCESYRRSQGLDIVTLRLDHLYGIPETRSDINNICSKMCLEALAEQTITIDEGSRLSLLFERDAVEYIYRMATATKHNSSLYNISSSAELTEREMAEMVQKAMGYDVRIVAAGSVSKRRILSNRLFESEFGNPFFCDTAAIVNRIVEQMKKNRRIYLRGEDDGQPLHRKVLKKAGWLVEVLIPFAENLVAFIPFFMLNNRAVGSRYFANLDFYLLYVLLFAIVYGQQQATFSAVLAVAGYCFRQMYDRSGFEVMLDANTYVWMAQLFILGMAVGYMRDSITKLKRESAGEREFLSLQLHDIRDINSSNVRVKDSLETQIINQNDSVGKIYSITSALDRYSPEEVLFYAAEVIGKLVKSRDVAIYVVSNAEYARLFSSTSPKARTMGNSIRYPQLGEMYQTLEERKVFINRRLDNRYPLMANAIYDDGGSMQMIVMIWSIPWESMTLGQANQLVVISALIHNAVLRANRYLAALEEKRYVEDTQMLETEAFSALVRAYTKAERKGLTECIVLKVRLPEGSVNYREVGKSIMGKLRQTDYMGTMRDGGVYVLLPNTNSKDAQPVRTRLADIGYESDIMEGSVEWRMRD